MAIYETLKLSNTQYANKPLHIFTDSLNSIYLLLTQISHSTLQNNHPEKTILNKMATMLQQKTQSTTITKVRTHSNIEGNDIAYTLTKVSCFKQHFYPTLPHEHAHTTAYYL